MNTINRLLTTLMLVSALASCGTGGSGTVEANYNVVPLPNEIEAKDGAAFILSESTQIVFPEGNEKMQRNAQFLAEYLELSAGIKTAVTATLPEKDAIILATGLQNDHPDAFRISITEPEIRIEGTTEAAVFLGLQTLRKSIPVGNFAQVSFTPAVINDAPRFGYRGAMLDVARHFQPTEFIKKYIDLLALHQMNTFHWHLTDDQGWRIEIDAYPKLTEIGSMRKETVIGRNSGEYDGIPHGGYYTKEELREIVTYAEERYITIIPRWTCPATCWLLLLHIPSWDAPADRMRFRVNGVCSMMFSAPVRGNIHLPGGSIDRGNGNIPLEIHPHWRGRITQNSLGRMPRLPGSH